MEELGGNLFFHRIPQSLRLQLKSGSLEYTDRRIYARNVI